MSYLIVAQADRLIALTSSDVMVSCVELARGTAVESMAAVVDKSLVAHVAAGLDDRFYGPSSAQAKHDGGWSLRGTSARTVTSPDGLAARGSGAAYCGAHIWIFCSLPGQQASALRIGFRIREGA
jgi:hypothetical protein